MDEIKYGLIGEKLGYSYSKLIYDYLGIDYKLIEIDNDHLESFLKEKNFKGLNVTIPYKEKVIPYLDEVIGVAKEINVCNTIVNIDGKLIGYNTDYDGFSYLLNEYGELENKEILVIGTGATSKTVKKVLFDKGVKDVKVASRKEGYDYKTNNLTKKFDFVINTTPVGTYPNICDKINVESSDVIDVVYNPYRTRLALDNKFRASGFDMLIVQALKSMELFNIKINKSFDEIKRHLLLKVGNIVLIGMPGSGKTTLGKLLSRELSMPFVDTDQEIERTESIDDIIGRSVDEFREIEKNVIKKVSLLHGAVIATGGGTVENEENIKVLASNGFIIYIERDVDEIFETFTPHPLIKTKEELLEVYLRRRDLYLKYSDLVIECGSLEDALNDILTKLKTR